MIQKRLFIVSSRLPVQITANEDDVQLTFSTDEMASAIKSYLSKAGQLEKDFSEYYWVGVPGCTTGSWSKAIVKMPESGFRCLPVFTSKAVYDSYYNGFCVSVLWPLFHYFPSHAEYNYASFDNYIKINHDFFEVLNRHIRPNDVIWIHDYHLLPLAGIIRNAFPSIAIGFFLHQPFPSFEIVRLLPRKWQEVIVKGMLGADLIGFQTIDYACHFIQSVQMILGLDNDMHVFLYDNRLIKVDVFPASIDYQHLHKAFDDESISNSRRLLKEKFIGKKIIFSIDRLDYTTGVQNRLKAYEHFLMNNPGYLEKVVFILVIAPFRESILKNADLKKIADETVRNINSKHGNSTWKPIIYQCCTLAFDEKITFYTACDVAFMTPLRDGMNLHSKEFIASRKDKMGALVLSEMAGAARELTYALMVNPNDIVEMADQLRKALEISDEDQMQGMENMQSRIKQYDIGVWAEDFLHQLNTIKKRQLKFQVRFIEDSAKRDIFDSYRRSKRRLLLLDYDGTLVSFSALPADARPDPRLIDLLKRLCDKESNEVFIISGRDSVSLENWVGHLKLNIISEHGARIKLNGNGWETQASTLKNWKPYIKEIMDSYVRRCANSLIEEKDFSIVWHYRNANPEQGKLRSLELVAELNEYTHGLELQVMMGNKIVEVRSQAIDKGKAVKKILLNSHYDFILAAGDDSTDEDMFKELADTSNAYTIKIGSHASYATYNLHTSNMMISMLEALSNLQ